MESLKKRDYRTIITIISVLLVFTGFRLNHVLSWTMAVFAPKALDEIVNDDNPERYDWYKIKATSDAYYVVSDISIQPLNFIDTLLEEIVYESDIKIILNFKDRGKKEVKNPMLEIIVLDPFLRMRANWTRNLNEQEYNKKIILKYGFPSLDSKVMGYWRVDLFLYDDIEERTLVSYSSQDFRVKGRSTDMYILIIVLIVTLIAASIFTYRELKELKLLPFLARRH